MSIEWIQHKGKRILYVKYSDLSTDEALAQIRKATQTLVDSHDRNNLTLSDVRDAHIDQDFVDLSKAQGKISKDYTKKAAIVGVEGVRKILLKAVNMVSGNPREPFSTIEEAKDWLVKD